MSQTLTCKSCLSLPYQFPYRPQNKSFILRRIGHVLTLGSSSVLRQQLESLADRETIVHRVVPYTPTTSSPRPSVVLLLGWAGCSRSAVQRYVNLYQETLGCPTVLTCSAPLETYIKGMLRSQCDDITQTVLAALPTPTSSVHVHVFSNNGMVLLYALQKNAQNGRMPFSLGSVVMDCSPTRFAPRHLEHIPLLGMLPLARVLKAAFGQKDDNTWSVVGLAWALTVLRWEYYQQRTAWNVTDDFHRHAPYVLSSTQNIHVMFLYGLKDRIVFPSEVRYAIRWQEMWSKHGGGGAVTSHAFDSGHVALLKHNAAQYTDIMRSFLNRHYHP